MTSPGYDRLLIENRARKLQSRAKLGIVASFLFGATIGAALGAAGGFAFRFLTSLRFTLHNFMPGLNIEQATQSATQYALTWAVVGGLLCALAGVYRATSVATLYQFVAQTALCQAEIERHLARLADPSRTEPPNR